ncbi:hypothetical protein JOF29_004102 [Kribbella aluminosa]|uniref:DUF4089 domain-containing protein n=1 Tax=Kribbella aluminosa TaxID=416017 RepID=A0ABS4UN88_9ACTN|nr:hypothetical protein [Kribbella aluminosa]MBP2353019.1 hypothetical protein [Kribbella aluminosa]
MPENTVSDQEMVAALLQLHTLSPAPDEVDKLIAAYGPTRAAVAALYTMPGVRYEEPAITFDPRV